MKNSHQSAVTSPVEDVKDKMSEEADTDILKKNPKIDLRLLEEYERLAASGSGARLKKKGAGYNIAHPLSSKDRATDAYHRIKACAKPGADNRWGGVDCKGRHPRVVIAGSALKGQRLVRNAHPTIYVWLIHGVRVESVSRLPVPNRSKLSR